MARHEIPEPYAPVQLGDFLLGDHRFPAVYFLYDEDELVYVGQSTTLRWRIDQHIQDGVKIFDAVGFIPCCVSRLTEIESHYIRTTVPRYNQCAIAKGAREVDDLIPEDFPIRVVDGVNVVGSLGLSRIMNCDRQIAKDLIALFGKGYVTLIHAFQLAMSVRIEKDQNGQPMIIVR